MAKKRRASQKTSRRAEPKGPLGLKGLVPPEQIARGDIIPNARGGGSVLDWADKLCKNGHFDAQALTAFREFERLQEAIGSSPASLDYEKPRVQHSGASDTFSLHRLDAGKRLKRIYECIGAKHYKMLTMMIGARNSGDVRIEGVDHRRKPELAAQSVAALLSHMYTIKVLVSHADRTSAAEAC